MSRYLISVLVLTGILTALGCGAGEEVGVATDATLPLELAAVPGGLEVRLADALATTLSPAKLAQHLTVTSWPNLGAAAKDNRQVEAFSRVVLANDRKSFVVRLARPRHEDVDFGPAGRVYEVHLDDGNGGETQGSLVIAAFPEEEPVTHPDSSTADWSDLLAADLSNADYPEGVWWWEGDELTASEDQMLWSKQVYQDFDLDLEFRNDVGTNSGVLYHVSIPNQWVQNSIEVQVADDYSAPWVTSAGTWQCAAVFGRLPASYRAVNPAGEWNRLSLHVRGKDLRVILNGKLVIDADLSLWTEVKTNPDGTEIPEWLSKPLAALPAEGRIGFQGKHAGAPVWFRNIRVREVP